MATIKVSYRKQGAVGAKPLTMIIENVDLDDVWSDIYYEISEDYTVLGYTVVSE